MKIDNFEYITNTFHELKNPLTTVMLATEIIKTYDLNDNDKDVYLTMILDECMRMKNKIDDTIKSLKNNYFDVDINQKCDIHDIINRVALTVNKEEIGLYLMASRYMVLGNIEYIESSFRELIENSRKNKSELPLHIVITTLNKGNRIIIKFSDNGIGIEKKHLDHVFDEGFKGNKTEIIENQYNTGLGLYYLERNLQRINGTITVESKPDRGTLFTITLPLII